MDKQPNKRVYNALVVIWLTLSLGSVILAAITWSQLTGLVKTGRQVRSIADNLEQIMKLLLDGETGARGYVITDDKKFLEPLNQSVTNLPVCFDLLAQAVSGDRDLVDKVAAMHTRAEVCLNWQFKLAAARDRSQGSAKDLMAAGEGKAIMDGIRVQIDDLREVNDQQLAQIREGISDRLVRASLTSMGAGLLGLCAGIYAFRLSRLSLRHEQRERELNEDKLRAEHSNQEKNVFLANMSHEIRTPMNAILGFSELLQEELAEPRQQHYAESIRTSASSLLLLVNDILDVSKMEAGVMKLRPEPTDPREISDLVRMLFAEPAARKGLKLECQIEPDLPRALLIDRLRLRQILINLVGNALKFTDAGSVEVRVTWSKESTGSHVTLVIEVQDTGIGIRPDKVATIFDPFTQSGTHRDKESQGTGLGLAIVKRLVELMSGTVTVVSVLGQGSVFYLRFPSVPVSARLAQPEKAVSPVADFDVLSPSTLLVVDDNVLNCELIAAMFGGTRHRLVFATTGEDALARAREIKPDLVLLDIWLPGMDGRAVLAELRKMSGLELMPVLAVTASTLTDIENTPGERFSGYVRKPFTKRELFDELAGFLPGKIASEAVAESKAPDAPVNGSGPVPPELRDQLRQLLVHPWPSLRDSVAVNESRLFARGLQGLGKRWQCPALVAYAKTILRDVDAYAVADLEKHLGQFAALVEELVGETKQ